VPWPLGPVPMQAGPHTHLAGPPPPWAPTGGPPLWGPQPWDMPPPWALPKPLPHDVPTPFLLVMRARTWRWWQPLLGLFLLALVYTVAALVLLVAALGVLARGTVDPALDDLTDPATLLVTNLSLVVAIPVVWLCWVAGHQLPIGSSSSVLGRLRWDLFRAYVPLALLTVGVGLGVQLALGYTLDDGAEATGPVRSFALLVVLVLLTTPLQSAAEEYVFRGYVSQAIAAWIGRERAGALVAGVLTAALFSLAHVPGDVLLFLDRFAFGLAASAVVWLTGGLEAAIVLHAVNNVLILLLAGALGEGVQTDAAVTGWAGLLVVLLDVLAMAAYVLLVRRSVARRPPATRTPAQDLRPRLVGATPG
jgi:membrane protease YdiL (CAAX protease family)